MTISPSMTMILLWAMACWASIRVGMPALARKSATEYLSVRFDLSRMASTRIPRFWASTNALAMWADVKDYACIRILLRASPKTFTIFAVQSLPGVKHTVTDEQETSSTLADGDFAGRRVCWARYPRSAALAVGIVGALVEVAQIAAHVCAVIR